MATGNAAMPFSLAAKANRADNKLVILSKTNRPLPPPSPLQDAALKERNNSSFIIYRTRTLERVTPYCYILFIIHQFVCADDDDDCRVTRADVLSQRSDAVSKGGACESTNVFIHHRSPACSTNRTPRRTHPLYLLELKLNKRLLLRCCAVGLLYLS